MRRSRVDGLASAIARELSRGAHGRPRRGAVPAAVASAVANRLQSPRGPSPRGRRRAAELEIVASRLASALARRLNTSTGPGRPLSTARLTSGIARRVGAKLADLQPADQIHVSALDPAATAEALVKALTAKKLGAADPSSIVASHVTARLPSLRVAGTPKEARQFQGRVASIVVEQLRGLAQAQPDELSATIATEASDLAQEPEAALAAEPSEPTQPLRKGKSA